MRLWKPFAQRDENWSPVQPKSVSCQCKAVYLEHYFFFSNLDKSNHKGYLYALYSLCGCRARIKPPANSSGHLHPLWKFLACDSRLLPLMRCSFCNWFCFGGGFHRFSVWLFPGALLPCMCSLHVLLSGEHAGTLPHLSSPWWQGRGCTSMAKGWQEMNTELVICSFSDLQVCIFIIKTLKMPQGMSVKSKIR